MIASGEILEFWLAKGPKIWWSKDDEADREIIVKFSDVHAQASTGKLGEWEKTPDSALALIIVLDQFSRNMFRGSAKSFAQDARALEIAKQALSTGFDKTTNPALKQFFILPFMHSEKIHDQIKCVDLMHREGNLESLKFAILHRDIILQFGRFPHRNAVLGRHTSSAEQSFLDEGGFSG